MQEAAFSVTEAHPKPEPEPERPALLSVRDLTVIYEDDEIAIENISFDLRAGDRVAIIGSNGAGKSTLMKAIMGLIQPRAGSIQFLQEAADARLHVGYVPQNEEVSWDFPVTVRDVVMMGRARQIGWLRWPGRAHWRAVEEALARVQMSAFADRQIGELSGGQRRRVFIARALAQEARLLLLDEPFSGVDASAQASLMDVLDDLNHDGLTILLSTHDLNLAFQRFDCVLALHRQMVAYGPPQQVYTPETLMELYGGRLTVFDKGQPVTVFVDDHACEDC